MLVLMHDSLQTNNVNRAYMRPKCVMLLRHFLINPLVRMKFRDFRKGSIWEREQLCTGCGAAFSNWLYVAGPDGCVLSQVYEVHLDRLGLDVSAGIHRRQPLSAGVQEGKSKVFAEGGR